MVSFSRLPKFSAQNFPAQPQSNFICIRSSIESCSPPYLPFTVSRVCKFVICACFSSQGLELKSPLRTMSAVNIKDVTVLDNPAPFLDPFQFEISYECVAALADDLEWKLTYVGSAEDETYDQVLESVLVGPVNVGNYRFVFQADPPDPSRIREEDIIGVTVLLLTCSYQGQEFVRVGYYINNDYEDEQLREEPPQKVLFEKVQRNILADKPRVTKFPINFHPENDENVEQPSASPEPVPEVSVQGDAPVPLCTHQSPVEPEVSVQGDAPVHLCSHQSPVECS